jgi:hypothetical protein
MQAFNMARVKNRGDSDGGTGTATGLGGGWKGYDCPAGRRWFFDAADGIVLIVSSWNPVENWEDMVTY